MGIRLFTGIALDKTALQAVTELEATNGKNEGLRWTKPANLHITSCFIGHSEESRLDEIIKVLDDTYSRFSPFTLRFNKFGFAPGRKPRMIWSYFDEHEIFSQISVAANKALDLEMPVRSRPTPHITLARFKKPHYYYPINFNIPAPEIELNAQRITLWQSVTHSQGAEYTPIKEFELN